MNARLPLSLDALILTALVLTRARVDTISNAIVQRPPELVRQIPLVGGLLSDEAFDLLVDWLADPLSQIVLATTFGLLAIYLVVDVIQTWPGRIGVSEITARWSYRVKLTLLVVICLFSVVANTGMVMALRQLSTPSQFSHDGGVLMSDLAVKWLLEGTNVYQQDWRSTWVVDAYPNGPGLSHYPYLPFAFVPAAPLYLLTMGLWGWYDHRLVYLVAYLAMLAVTPWIAPTRGGRLALAAILALNPILANDLIYGYNDILLLGIVALALAAYRTGHSTLGGIAIGLAVATKGTIWPLLPFLALFLWRGQRLALDLRLLRPLLPIAIAALVFIVPFAVWDARALVEDTVLYNAGNQVADGLPIKGWGVATFVVALGWVNDLFAPFPFAVAEILIAGPLLAVLLVRQWKRNSLAAAFAHFGVFSLVFYYFSRTMNPNYLGMTLAMLAIGYFAAEAEPLGVLPAADPATAPSAP
ncbi:MAG: glycosyltransferase 87 family protein [Dehalococcoidia bacterium]